MSAAKNNQITHPHPQLVSKIGIVGAGISGIAAAKHLSTYNPVVFEATDSIGGVWKHCCYSCTTLQTPRCDFEFSDYPWPNRDDPSLPSYQEVLEYLHGYAKHFDVLKYIKFNSKVVEIRYVGNPSDSENMNQKPGDYGSLLNGNPVWEVAVQMSTASSVQWYAFELLVVCTGKYGDIPKLPSYPSNRGPEVFHGKVLHTMDYSKLDENNARSLLEGKKVAIIGYKKSAIDLAMECSQANQGPNGQPCTMVIRTLHWIVPSYRIWGLPLFLFYSTRSSQFLHERPNQSSFKEMLGTLFSPMRMAISKFIESYLLWKLPLEKYKLVPNHPFEEDYASCHMAIVPEHFFDEANKGKILFKKASNWWFWSGGIEFDDQTKLEADVVILATGYDGNKKLKSILPEPFRSLVVDSTGFMPLYRGVIHPLIPNMAFVGYIESVSNLHTAEMRCKWLAKLAEDAFKLPSVDNMLGQITREIKAMKRTSRYYRKKPCISTFSINHTDEMCKEMGLNPWRKSNWFSEAFSPYGSHDYYEQDN